MRGGENVVYQGGNKKKTANTLFLTDKHEIPPQCQRPITGNHSDLYKINKYLNQMLGTFTKAKIGIGSLFLGTDSDYACNALIVRKIMCWLFYVIFLT